MAASPTPKTPDLSRCIAVAYSAGRDSTALLHASLCAAAEQGVQVVALHVHHGLSPQADAWLAHARHQCEAWAREGLPVRFFSQRLTTRPAAAESVEAWARKARYQALREMALAAGAGLVLLAHHRRDQAETLLLQGLRGAGVAGLAGMPARAQRDGIAWVRPWLSHSREEVEVYLRQHRLAYIDDDSNADPRFARNRLRLQVWPALTDAFPQAEASLADAAAWSAQAAECLAELAALDLAQVAAHGHMSVNAWRKLSRPRQANVLRAWFRQRSGRVAPASLVQRLQLELGANEAVQWPVPGGTLRRHRGALRFIAADNDVPAPAERETVLSIVRAGRFALPGWQGVLVARRVREGGVPLAWLAHLELRAREGGERFQAGLGRPPRSLKKQFQAVERPAWEREGPLVYSGGQLVFVPGLGLDARVIGLPGQAQLRLEWQSG